MWDWVITNHERKTHNKDFTAMLCVGSVEALIKYYEIFKAKKLAGDHNLRVVTIFTYGVNEDDADADGLIAEPDFDIADGTSNKHTRERLDEYIADYNAMYATKFSTKDGKSFYNYYKDIAKRIKEREKKEFNEKDRVDILLVVNMYLTGFDAKKVNTLYVDKNLKYHGLIQAFSRTNRILNEVKSQGNIVCFRNLKKATDDAIALFSNLQAVEEIIIEPYEVYVKHFNDAVEILKEIVPTVDSVNELASETEELAFVKAFRNLIRLKNILTGFSDFNFLDLAITEQEFEDYKSKYLDIYDKVKQGEGTEASIINDIDFELELIQRDEINVAYILQLLANLYHESDENHDTLQDNNADIEKQKKAILDLLGNEVNLRSKRELIEKFINENLSHITKKEEVKTAFREYWNEEKQKALARLSTEESLIATNLKAIIDEYHFTGRTPSRETIVESIEKDNQPKLRERKSVTERIITKIKDFYQNI